MGLTKHDVTEQHCINCAVLFEPEWFEIVVFILDIRKLIKDWKIPINARYILFWGMRWGK